ncbi:YrdB family protein [Bacillus sp. FJAT-27251]|uniref:YrdB family protein n=1 Tax=Bacillus sp. FJAT-27251 TaxID=1684142 RepID=UPI0006A7EC5B|nr:YrdB family protein [Bacillus sp. FJAT-27251]
MNFMIMNLALRFILEVCALIALSYWGFQTGKGFISKFGLGIGSPLLIAIVWGVFGSPAAPIPVHGFIRLLLEIAIFGLSAIALYAAGHPSLALIFIILVVINRILMTIWNQ